MRCGLIRTGIMNPFWNYGYNDINEGIFVPYSYEEYVQAPDAQARMQALTQTVAQSCADEAAEVTGWPLNQIQSVVGPNNEHSSFLDDLGSAISKAGDEIKSHCPTNVSFTPTGRLADMRERFEGMTRAVDVILPPLTRFYESLSDEQKARFNAIGTRLRQNGQVANAATPQAECGASIVAWPNDQIIRVVRPDDAQRAKLDALQSAAGQAADIIKAACPAEIPATPPGRLAAVGKRLQAILQAVQTIQPALADFYNALNDDQKARFNTLGRQILAENVR